MMGTTVGLGTALGPIVGGALIELGGPHFGWRLVFFINVPIGIAVVTMARKLLPKHPPTGHHRLDVIGSALLGSATLCILLAAVEYTSLKDPRLFWLGVPAAALFGLFLRRERRLTAADADPLVDMRLFRRPSYTAGIALALAYFPAMAGLPFVMAIYYQDGLGYSALQSAFGVTAYALGNAVAAPVAGRFVTRVGRPLVVAAASTFALGAIALALVAHHGPGHDAALLLAAPLFVMGCGSGALITPNQTLSLIDVDPIVGSTAGGVLQTAQRIGLAIGQAVITSVFFASLGSSSGAGAYGRAVAAAVLASLCFVAAAIAVGIIDLRAARRRSVSTTG